LPDPVLSLIDQQRSPSAPHDAVLNEAVVAFAKAYTRLSPYEKRLLRGLRLIAYKLPPLAPSPPWLKSPTALSSPIVPSTSARPSPRSSLRPSDSPSSAHSGGGASKSYSGGGASHAKARRALGFAASTSLQMPMPGSRSASPSVSQLTAKSGNMDSTSASQVTADALGSTRRTTPRGEHPGAAAPDGAEWISVLVSLPHHKTALKYDWALSASGDPLCMYCMKVIESLEFAHTCHFFQQRK